MVTVPGAYAFARNVLIAVIADYLDQPGGFQRAEQLLQRLSRANEEAPTETDRMLGEQNLAMVLAMLRTAQSATQPPEEQP